MSISEYQFPEIPEELDVAYRDAHRALERLLPNDSSFVREADFTEIFEVIEQLPTMARKMESAINAYLGPEISWQTDHCDEEWNWAIAGVSLDDVGQDFGVKLKESAFEGECGKWSDSPLDLAARAYKREAGWDFAPGEVGFWVVMLAPFSMMGAGDEWSYFGRIAGFLILYDRDEDGIYESVGHMWTAHAWRRRGVARHLLQTAKEKFAYKRIEGPLTKDSAALLKAHPEFSGDQREAT